MSYVRFIESDGERICCLCGTVMRDDEAHNIEDCIRTLREEVRALAERLQALESREQGTNG